MAECLETIEFADDLNRYAAIIDIPVPGNKLAIEWSNRFVTGIDFLPDSVATIETKDPVLLEVIQRLLAYFDHGKSELNIPIKLAGTKFQQRVWQAIQTIPSGAVATYAELAMYLENHPRAIGGACRRNPVPIIVPCHRVVASNGIGGFAGAVNGKQINLKQWLLNHEGITL